MDKFLAQGGILEPGENAEDGILSSRCGIGCVPFMEGKSGWTHNDVVLKAKISDAENWNKYSTKIGI